MVDLFKNDVGSGGCSGELSEGGHFRGVATTRGSDLLSKLAARFVTDIALFLTVVLASQAFSKFIITIAVAAFYSIFV
jgi:hypothetical protein